MAAVDTMLVKGLELQVEELRLLIERAEITSQAPPTTMHNGMEQEETALDVTEKTNRLEALMRENEKLQYQLAHLKASYLRMMMLQQQEQQA